MAAKFHQRLIILVLLVLPAMPALAQDDQAAKMNEVISVLDEIAKIPEKNIPPALLRDAQGVAIIPSVVKVGLIIGGRYGKGVVLIRGGDGNWSNPVFVSLTGGSVGWQIGAQSTDVVLVFKTQRSIDGLINGKFTLGVDAAAAAGPVGRTASASTDAQLKAEIYSYSRSRGLFAGLALDGASLQIANSDNAAYYREFDLSPAMIFEGKNKQTPGTAVQLKKLLMGYAR